MMRRLAFGFAVSVLAACSGNGMVGNDVPTGDAAMDAMDSHGSDTGVSDVQSPTDVQTADTVVTDNGATDVPSRDSATRDVPTGDAAVTCGAGAVCRAYWCGCGRCNPAEIRCVSDGRVCGLECASFCPELETTVCRCVGNECQVQNPVDAGADAGGLAEGEICEGAGAVCAPGLLCCYPGGIPGLMNRCIQPDRMTGRCPLFP